jgi:hypothetical protein
VVVFFIDFFIRVLINPKFAPSLILGRMVVSNQTVEYVGAAQKRFAWTIGLLLGAGMMWLLVLHDIRGPLNLLICASCLLLLFFETAFSICLGCLLHHWITRKKAVLCPGDVCEIKEKEPIQRVSIAQLGVMVVFVVFLIFLVNDYRGMRSGQDSQLGITPSRFQMPSSPSAMPTQGVATPAEDCTPPSWVSLIGRTEQWKLHHGCTTTE